MSNHRGARENAAHHTCGTCPRFHTALAAATHLWKRACVGSRIGLFNQPPAGESTATSWSDAFDSAMRRSR